MQSSSNQCTSTAFNYTDQTIAHLKQPYLSKEWNEVHIRPGENAEAIHYGPLSSSFFGYRMEKFLNESLYNSNSEDLFATEYTRLQVPSSITKWKFEVQSSLIMDEDMELKPGKLSRGQEQYFLDIFWQAFHCLYPIILESEFRDYYDSLWRQTDDQVIRKSSVLVDSILAICLQFGSAFLTSDAVDGASEESVYHVDKGLETAHYYFRRCQIGLFDEMERPSILTLQSHIYCVVYLLNLSRFNAAHTILGAAMRVAHSLKIFSQPPQTMSQARQELYIRIWHTMIALDYQISMILGRQPIIDAKNVPPSCPRDGHEQAMLSGSMLFSPNNEDISWLSFNRHSTQLLIKVQAVQASFYQQAAQKLEQRSGNSIYEYPALVEELASYLGREVRAIYDWARKVPQSLKFRRKGSGEAFSTERTALDFDGFSPLWLQRQRVLLEILYHHVQLSSLRSFLRFSPGSSSITPLSDCHSINCLNHAIILTNILHQVLSETDILRGFSSIFQYQWDAALCIIGFVLANPVCPPTPAARKSIQTAIESFEYMGKYHPAAREAAQKVCEVGAQAEILVERFHSSLSSRPPPESRRVATSAAVQHKAAPALTPEYLQGLTADSEFDITEFLSDAALPTGDHSVAVGDATLENFADDMQAGMAMPWINDALVLESLGLFPG